MAETIEVVVPRRPQNEYERKQLSADQALQFTPMTTSIQNTLGRHLTSTSPDISK
jgi:hypothetical protein